MTVKKSSINEARVTEQTKKQDRGRASKNKRKQKQKQGKEDSSKGKQAK
jgi:hypothetical protein